MWMQREDVRVRVLNALYWDLAVPRDRLNVDVENGWVTVSGMVDLPYQRACAESDAKSVPGVVGVTNRILLAEVRAANPQSEEMALSHHRRSPQTLQTLSLTASAALQRPPSRRPSVDGLWSAATIRLRPTSTFPRRRNRSNRRNSSRGPSRGRRRSWPVTRAS